VLPALLMTTTLMLASAAGDEISREQLIQLIDAAQTANHQDVSFDYEGRKAVPSKSGPEQVMDVYTGSFIHRSDGAALTDLYHFDQQFKEASHGVVAILDGTTSSSDRRADQKNASISIKKQGPLEYAGPGNYRQIWLADLVKKFALSPYVYEFEGMRQHDGADCIVVRFRLVYTKDEMPKDKTLSEIFWVDLNRGGHVIRHESRVPGNNLSTVTTVQLQRFEPRPGRVVWLPCSGKFEGMIDVSKDFKRIFATKPVWYSTYDLLPLTIRFDRGLKDEVFSIKPRTGDAISDEVRKARYEFGQYMVRPVTVTRNPTDAEVKAELDRMLKDSKVMANELKATAPPLEESGWWTRWPWAVVGASLLGVGFVYYRQRRG